MFLDSLDYWVLNFLDTGHRTFLTPARSWCDDMICDSIGTKNIILHVKSIGHTPPLLKLKHVVNAYVQILHLFLRVLIRY